jgi:hypothetical protein
LVLSIAIEYEPEAYRENLAFPVPAAFKKPRRQLCDPAVAAPSLAVKKCYSLRRRILAKAGS